MSRSCLYEKITGRSKQHYIRLLCGLVFGSALAIGAGVCFVIIGHFILGNRETGVANNPDELPTFLRDLAPFAVEWPIHYTYFRHPHGTASYLICGKSSRKQIESVCKKCDIMLSQLDNDEEIQLTNSAVHEILPLLTPSEEAIFCIGEFAHNDWTFFRNDHLGNTTIGTFRPSDGYFVIRGVRSE